MNKLLPLIAFSVLLLIPVGAQNAFAQVIDPVFSGVYSFTDIGPAPGVPNPFGGLTIKAGDTSKLLIGGDANTANGIIYEVDLVRDGNNHITGFSGSATPFITAPFNDGGVDYGPNGVLFLARWPSNELGQSISGSGMTDKVIDLVPLLIANSPGGATIVPAGFPGAGQLKLNSWPNGEFYDATLVPDGGGTFDLNPVVPIATSTLPGGPEGFVYVPIGSQLFPNPSILVSEFSANQVTTYDVDGNGNPNVGTQRVFMTGLDGAEGATIDPLTGDFMFSTFGSGMDRVIVVQGFLPPSQEICDGIDNDDDNQIDEGLGQTTCGVGECSVTVDNCVGGVTQTCTPGTPESEVCDSLDNNCDGTIDDDLMCNGLPQTVGGELIPIESTSLLLAGAQTFSWMIPVVLSVLGIGLFVVYRKSEN